MSNRQRVLKRSNEADVEEVPASSSFFEFDDLIVVALKYCVFLVIEILAVATHGHLITQSVKELDIFSKKLGCFTFSYIIIFIIVTEMTIFTPWEVTLPSLTRHQSRIIISKQYRYETQFFTELAAPIRSHRCLSPRL